MLFLGNILLTPTRNRTGAYMNSIQDTLFAIALGLTGATFLFFALS